MSLVKNQKAYFDYEILEKFDAGLQLRGFEVKALKLGRGKLVAAHIIVRGDEAYLVGAAIEPYQAKNMPADYEAGRTVKLLVTKKEIGRLADIERQPGLTIIPLSVYNKNGKLKLELAIARGKKKYDKRQAIKQRDTDREIRRTLKNN
ncbi:MAG: SsrA-binding protein SmpB [Candidatus Vogelbacteria bacterium]|nr:SsrA-binding protein SmpB [Candidatus Vogelbacteria bacterium]